MTYQYATLADLKAAYDSGELSRENWLTIDNDHTSVYDRVNDNFQEKLFDGCDPASLLGEALTLLGIPWEYA